MNRSLDLSCLFRHIGASIVLCVLLSFVPVVRADVDVPSIFGSHMVLQRQQANPVWGWAEPGETITVSIGDQEHRATADDNGQWRVTLDSMPVGGPHELTIAGKNRLEFTDVLIGEVWVCSGQSNMAWSVDQADDPDLEKLTANFPGIRIISVPQVGTQEPQNDFEGQWQRCTPETIGSFSAVGYFFGRQLHQTLDVPIGLIDTAWGGSACEAWIRRDLLDEDDRFAGLMERWREQEENFDFAAARAEYQTRLEEWQKRAEEARAAGNQPPARPRAPRDILRGNHRPSNIYNGVLNPIIGYGIRGSIWYQGESNAGRAYQYRDLFPLMIQNWRDEWNQGDFSFYWVQLADFQDETSEPADSSWAELREAQTMTLDRVSNTGQAVITDLGEAHDIHPKNKQDVAKRLARLALANDYNVDIVSRSPRYESMEIKGNRVILTFRDTGGGLDTFDVRQPRGFTIAGEDQKFVHAQARIVDAQTMEVWSDEIETPVAVRYAWSDNPVCNVQNREGLPLTSFRTDRFKGVTADAQ